MHVLWPIFHFKLNGVAYKNIRNGLGHFLVEFRSMSGQKRSNFKVDIFAYNGYQTDAARHGESNGGLCFALRGLESLKIEFENLTSSILNIFFLITWPKKRYRSKIWYVNRNR